MEGVTFTLTKNAEGAAGTPDTTDANGNLTFSNLDLGNYTLVETVPDGYTGAGPWTVTVTDVGAVFVETTGPVGNVLTNIWTWIVSVLPEPRTS
jgi:uncharacterized surface anchored protein